MNLIWWESGKYFWNTNKRVGVSLIKKLNAKTNILIKANDSTADKVECERDISALKKLKGAIQIVKTQRVLLWKYTPFPLVRGVYFLKKMINIFYKIIPPYPPTK